MTRKQTISFSNLGFSTREDHKSLTPKNKDISIIKFATDQKYSDPDLLDYSSEELSPESIQRVNEYFSK